MTGKTCKDCGRNTPWTDWERCEACYADLRDAHAEYQEEASGLSADECREIEEDGHG